jgi:hypothetical protein
MWPKTLVVCLLLSLSKIEQIRQFLELEARSQPLLLAQEAVTVISIVPSTELWCLPNEAAVVGSVENYQENMGEEDPQERSDKTAEKTILLFQPAFCLFSSVCECPVACDPIVHLHSMPSVEFNGNFSLLGVWKMESQCKFAGNQHSQMNLSKIRNR